MGKYSNLRELLSFVFFGFVCLGISLVAMGFFETRVAFPKSYLYAVVSLFVFLLNFAFSDNIVWRHKRHYEPRIGIRFGKFIIGKGTGLLINNATFFLVAELLGLSSPLATLSGSATGMLFNFGVGFFWIYAPRKQP